MMKILFTESSSNIGGQELQALAQMTALRKQGHSVLLACREKSKIAPEARKRGHDVTYIPFRNSIHLPSILRLRQIIGEFKPDLVICHSGHDSNIAGLSRLICCHRFSIVRQKTYITRKTRTFSLNYLCDAIAVPGTAIMAHLKAEGVRTPITVIPPGFDWPALHNEAMRPLPPHIQAWAASADNVPLIVQVGMLRPEKGHEFMLRVLHQLKMKGKSFRWLVVGAGREEYEARLRLQTESLGMNGDVLMAGALFPALPVYRIASVVVMPSENEAFGMVLAEASAFGVPVIASETGGIPDVIQNNVTGTLLPVGDVSAWTSALSDFLSRPERFRMIAASAREDIEYRFDINRTAQTIVSLAYQAKGKRQR
ncbi:glycosyltransferase family 4 protein [Escherichia coli]|uniref:glycosyltransferase family 4 protein n=1 Tax=Escherichia coli TaxID=562 RepID=UPI00128EE961|nr:glycosyltransferase family 4 protein [Escherichia coli]MQK94757.1 glycosyltransferase [Escherichia coli]HCO6567056.1 glycosyltransferase family 4 protein [Escherichia coli]